MPRPPFQYHSEQLNTNKNKTRRNIVTITNGKGSKRVEEYDSRGERIYEVEKPLTPSQINKIKKSIFIPGLFKDCCGESEDPRSKTRKVNRKRK